METARVAELTFGKESMGSGYLITARHVLTARHVVKPAREGTPCTVQPLMTVGQEDLPLNAQVRPRPMPGAASWLSKTHDLAIVELTEPIPALPAKPVSLGRIRGNDLGLRRCRARGFPAAAGRDDVDLEGKLAYVAESKHFDLNVGTAPPANYKEWVGFSGAAVFCGGLAVGVMRTVDGRWNSKLTATPVQHLLEDASFQNYWKTQSMEPFRIEDVASSTLPDRIARYAYLIDRKDAVYQIHQHVRKLPANSLPQVIAILGEDNDEHEFVILQLADHREMQRLLGREASSEQVIVPLPWPDIKRIDPDESFRTLVREICISANVAAPTAGVPMPFSELRASFDSGTVPRAFWALIRRKIAFGGQGRLLRQLLDFWLGLGEGRLPILLFLCLAWDEHQNERQWLRNLVRTRPQPDMELDEAYELALRQERLVPVDPLEIIASAHIDPWIKELGFRCAPVHPDRLARLGLGLRRQIGDDGRRMRQVAADLYDLLDRI